MRTALLALAAVGAVATAAAAEPKATSVAPVPRTTVHLYSDADLAQLQADNPDHYARALRVVAAANHLCRSQAAHAQYTAAAARDVSCSADL
jgi:hypothetical protein